MPRAENRKRPPSQLGQKPGHAKTSEFGMGHGAAGTAASSKKQDLIEKMKQLQQSKKSE